MKSIVFVVLFCASVLSLAACDPGSSLIDAGSDAGAPDAGAADAGSADAATSG